MAASPVSLRYRVEGMDCASCVAKVETALARVPGLSNIRANAVNQTLAFELDEPAKRAEAERLVADLGHALKALASSRERNDPQIDESPWWKSRKAQLTIGCGLALVGAFLTGRTFPEFGRWAYLAALVVGLVPIARRAIIAAFAGLPFTIEMLMTIAATGAVIIGASEEAATVVFLFLVGELLEGVAASRARAGIRGLIDLVPKTALVERNGQLDQIPADDLSIGAVIVVRPGDRIPADGDIIEGESSIDESPLTGESVPKRKTAGSPAYAGTISTDGVLRIRVTAATQDNTIARVVRLVEEAQESKAPTERFIERFSRWYTPAVVVAAALVAIIPPLVWSAPWSEWIYRGLAVLLIGCPCALVISTPAAIAAGLSAGARRGLLIKGGVVLEALGRITTAALDKTGTLTEGKPKVTDVIALGRSEREVLSLTAALEASSNHPLALAIVAHAKTQRVPIPPSSESGAIAGKGVAGKVGGVKLFFGSPQAAGQMTALSPHHLSRVEALNSEGKTVSVLVANGAVAGIIAMRDEPREDAKRGVDALKAAGITPLMLTGDNSRMAKAIAGELGIEVRAELLPEDKQKIVRELQDRGTRVAKIGDGINDAPALASADVGIAMGGGTDVALETADAAVLHGRVMDVARMVHLSRAVMANIHQNITIALGLKVVFLVTTIAGITGLWPAILADTGATVLVTLNALRLLKVNV